MRLILFPLANGQSDIKQYHFTHALLTPVGIHDTPKLLYAGVYSMGVVA
jgi:hypothetical protein